MTAHQGYAISHVLIHLRSIPNLGNAPAPPGAGCTAPRARPRMRRPCALRRRRRRCCRQTRPPGPSARPPAPPAARPGAPAPCRARCEGVSTRGKDVSTSIIRGMSTSITSSLPDASAASCSELPSSLQITTALCISTVGGVHCSQVVIVPETLQRHVCRSLPQAHPPATTSQWKPKRTPDTAAR